MRILLISDSHTKANIEFIIEYLKKRTDLNLNLIIINGDILGENECKEGYGFNYNKTLFETGLLRYEILKGMTSEFENLRKVAQAHTEHRDEKMEIEFSRSIMTYVQHRYDYLLDILVRFSQIAPTYFNLGTYESPLHYKVLNELAWLLDVPASYIRGIALLSPYREIFKEFQSKLKNYDSRRLKYIGGGTMLVNDIVIAGIAGYNESTVGDDKMSQFQEKMTVDLLNTIRRQYLHANKLILLNQSQGRLRKDPFSFRPSSQAVREFIEEVRGKFRHKVFVQSYHHFMTTHFYKAMEFDFILNNSAVNNSLFNMIDIGQKLVVYDVDPKLDKIRQLSEYNYNLVDYQKPEERLALNYSDSEAVIEERNLKDCYYM